MNPSSSFRTVVLLVMAGAFALTLVPFSLSARATEAPTRKVTVTGTATIKVVPDEMLWSIQVGIDDATLAQAKGRHDESLGAVLNYLKSLGDSIKDTQTGGIRFEKRLYPPDSPDVKARPFNCSTQVTFTLTNFDKYGPISDSLAKFDGVQVQSVDYASSKADAVKRDALKQALVIAHDKANDLALTADCYILKPLDIQEESDNVRPLPMRMLAMTGGMAGGTPDAVAGQIEISATVTATYDLFFH